MSKSCMERHRKVIGDRTPNCEDDEVRNNVKDLCQEKQERRLGDTKVIGGRTPNSEDGKVKKNVQELRG